MMMSIYIVQAYRDGIPEPILTALVVCDGWEEAGTMVTALPYYPKDCKPRISYLGLGRKKLEKKVHFYCVDPCLIPTPTLAK